MIHQPTSTEAYDVQFINEQPALMGHMRKLFKIAGNMHGKQIDGKLAIFTASGDFTGFNWIGTALSQDEQQVLLDLVADQL
jgi:hypothetical protein